MVCPPVRLIIHLLKLVDYLSIKADNHVLYSTFLSRVCRYILLKLFKRASNIFSIDDSATHHQFESHTFNRQIHRISNYFPEFLKRVAVTDNTSFQSIFILPLEMG